MSKVTVVSMIPRPINEYMPHIQPERYLIAAAKFDDFEILVVDDAVDLVYMRDGEHLTRMVPARDVAEAIVRSIISSVPGIGENSRPGIFFIEGELDKDEIRQKYGLKLTAAKLQQITWFKSLVAKADEDWIKYHVHGMVPAITRDAATYLKLDREWMLDLAGEEVMSCPACGSKLPNKTVTKCATCLTVIDPARHEKMFGTGALATK